MNETVREALVVSYTNPDDTWLTVDEFAYQAIFIGPVGNPAAPVGIMLRAGHDVGDRIAGTRSHDTPVLTVVVEGSIQLDGRWMLRGDLHLAPRGSAHGDLVIGPDGATIFFFFAQRSGLLPTFSDSADQRRFDEQCEPAVRAVASGEAEHPVALLPSRPTHSPRRGVIVTDLGEVKRLQTAAAPE